MTPREKETNIPENFPLKQYLLHMDYQKEYDKTIIGIDSGVSHCAFCECNLIKADGCIKDLEIRNLYSFEDEISKIKCHDDRFYFLAQKYWELFYNKVVWNVTFEVLPLTSIKKNPTLQGVIQAQKTTDIISLVCHCLGHPYTPIPPTSIKYTLTGKGNASKQEMQQAAYKLTGEKYPVFLENDHLADAFGDCFNFFVRKANEYVKMYHASPPEKYAHMDWLWKK